MRTLWWIICILNSSYLSIPMCFPRLSSYQINLSFLPLPTRGQLWSLSFNWTNYWNWWLRSVHYSAAEIKTYVIHSTRLRLDLLLDPTASEAYYLHGHQLLIFGFVYPPFMSASCFPFLGILYFVFSFFSHGGNPGALLLPAYPSPNSVNVSTFVIICHNLKNYLLWETQILSLIRSYGFIYW